MTSKVRINDQDAETIGGTDYGPHLDLKENGQQADYVILSAEERAKGFVEPVRRSYRHLKCGVVTTMGQALAETYARDPGFYSGTFCCGCRAHFAVGADGEFVWDGTDQKVGTRSKIAAPVEDKPTPAPDLSRVKKLSLVISGMSMERWSRLDPTAMRFYDEAAERVLVWIERENDV